MAIIYLQPGQLISCFHSLRIGASGTCVDTRIDFLGTAVGHATGKAETEAIGEYYGAGNLTYDIHMDQDTGRFWYDDERGR